MFLKKTTIFFQTVKFGFFPSHQQIENKLQTNNYTLQDFTYTKGSIWFKKTNLPSFTLKFERYTSLKKIIVPFFHHLCNGYQNYKFTRNFFWSRNLYMLYLKICYRNVFFCCFFVNFFWT